jgi:bifunctional UDP-N-acetylglucosamine pyrophosphorylase/glucosamine-1-phosphate N-acetyltransferase
MKLSIIILAAGLGKRMCSSLPKVMHPIGGKPMLAHILATARALNPSDIYVVQNPIMPILSDSFKAFDNSKTSENQIAIKWVTQAQQLGTGDAVQSVMAHLISAGKADQERVLILCGDTPLVSSELLSQFICDLENSKTNNRIGFISTHLNNPTGFGRVVRNADNQVLAITEERDASESIRAITEINSGILCLSLGLLKNLLPKLSNNNAQKEYYLTDLIQLAVQQNIPITTTCAPISTDVLGVNTRVQQAEVERLYQQKQIQQLMSKGVCVLDPARVDIRGEIHAGTDVTIDVNTIFEGQVILGSGTKIGANCILVNCEIGEEVEILPFSHLSGVKVGKHCQIGPYARIRPDSVLADGVKIGNFVEIKKTQVGTHSKINHLSYVGDAIIGSGVNIGAGTITCNYDGTHKHQTIIEDDVHVGSDTQLVAPVIIRKGTTIAAGSTITRDTEAGKLTLTQELNQRVIENWTRPTHLNSDLDSKKIKQ